MTRPGDTSVSPSRGTAAGQRLRGLVAAIVLLVLLVGIPWGLLAVGGTPWPTHLSLGHVRNELLSPDDGSAFLSVLKVVGWLAWLSFAAMILLEVAARARGVRAPALRGFHVQQRTAAALVGAVALLFSVAGPVVMGASAEAATVNHQVTSSQVQHDAGSAHGVATADQGVVSQAEHEIQALQQVAQSAHQDAPVKAYTVQPGDSLYSIAESHLGSGDRFGEIAALNYGVLQEDGATLTPSHWLHPGWVLKVPAEVHEQAAVQHVVVQPGDTLSSIAEHHLGDANRYDELVAASKDTMQPGGEHLTDPNLIKPGWTITIPGAHADNRDATQQAAPTQAPAPVTPDRTVTVAHHADPGTAGDDGGTGGGTGGGRHVGLPSDMVTAAAADHDRIAHLGEGLPDEHVQSADLGMADSGPLRAAGVGGLLAAGLLGAVVVRRRRTAPSESAPAPDAGADSGPEAAALEAELRAAAPRVGPEAVDLALRGLAQACAAERRPLPVLRSVRLTPDRIELYLDAPAVLPSPWSGASGATTWSLGTDRIADLDEAGLSGVASPYPGLVTVGQDLQDGDLLLDLAQVGTFGVVGDDEGSRSVLAAVAAELGTNPWSRRAGVTLVGAFRELPEHLGGNLRHRATVVEALADVAARPVDAPLDVLVLAGEVAASQRDELVAVVERTPGVALIATGSGGPVGRWVLYLEEDGPGSVTGVVQPLGLPLRPQQLDGPTYDRVLAALGSVMPSPRAAAFR